MNQTPTTLANDLTLDEVVDRLGSSAFVDGLVLFGSTVSEPGSLIADYDLLLLVDNPPVSIFQMLTHIDGRMADLVFVEVEAADNLIKYSEPVSPISPEGMLLLKLRNGQIVYDASERLRRIQSLAKTDEECARLIAPSKFAARYHSWFWQNHGLYHMKRMSQSDDPIYLSAVDLMLLSGLSEVTRSYYSVRNLPWEGEKAAVRYLRDNDPGYFDQLTDCIRTGDRVRKLDLYERLVEQALAPVGELWKSGITTAYLRERPESQMRVETALSFRDEVLSP